MSALRHAAVALLWLLAAQSCEGIFPRGKGPGEPCTRSSECEAELICRGGVCATAQDGGAGDGGSGDGGSEDAGP